MVVSLRYVSKVWAIFLVVVFVSGNGVAFTIAPSTARLALEATGFAALGAAIDDPAQQTGPDEDDDGQDPQVDDDDPCGPSSNVGSGSAGPGLHVTIAKGNVWTTIPVLKTYGGDEISLDLTLQYDSLRSYEDRGLGYGWTHS